uniref:Thiaminase-2/PQQC domain-containing protein n=1 Tax=Odontella aurita TaxID=265563 RepID=A0A7S4I7B7_9STRA|mmetsp:Transcript_2096/g.5532  ORF Transcript_2096/g.5532 Transcript_2096/m.5532 type:complete len:234 (+) Transcript_2096:183-884(+)|eukprot:CAMPEP_0113567592 /NCGR_PEP_ID=MMETSP0015_2-20120614/23360_1 /TAXON_ID=2838 /ORGANISM="Odontella" /LENGTH=233 /DNA_ID=CAMNT_0000470001 /DNA_START=82 /DNA_END=783 /DNA_ORIENTATION=+ /assembly_acc=CAM_ASM_000160
MSKTFWEAASDLIAVTEEHPFLVAMVDGSLDLEKFRYYVVQDALYLTDFAYCLRKLGSNAEIESDAKRLKELATGAEEAEMDLHRSFFKKWDIDATGAESMPNTLLYTSYMIRIVETGCHAEGLAVLLPCFWVYMHVGKCMLKLREDLGDQVSRPEQFDAWIDMYSGEDFENEVRDYIAMVDAAVEKADDATIKKMEEHFIMSCKLEHMFWDQAQELMGWPEIVNAPIRSVKN